MTQKYYAVIDFEGEYHYFYSKRKALKSAKDFHQEGIEYGYAEYGYVNSKVELKEFELPKISKKELVLHLLNGYSFMCNVVEIDYNK